MRARYRVAAGNEARPPAARAAGSSGARWLEQGKTGQRGRKLFPAERRRTRHKVGWRRNSLKVLSRNVRQAMAAMAGQLLFRCVRRLALVAEVSCPACAISFREGEFTTGAVDHRKQQPDHQQQDEGQPSEPRSKSCSNVVVSQSHHMTSLAARRGTCGALYIKQRGRVRGHKSARVKPGLPPWGPHVRFRQVQTLVRQASPLVKLRNSA